MPTDFPRKGEDQAITLRNSQYPQFDYDFAVDLRDNYPQIWRLGGNTRGNSAFTNWGRVRDGDESEALADWIKEREAWAARHFQNNRISGVVAQIKWGVIGTLGESGMKALVNERKEREQARGWFDVVAQTASATAQVRIYNEIGMFGISAEDFAAQLDALPSDIQQLDIRINSPGGSVHDGLAIYHALRRFDGQVYTYCDAMAASIASIIFLAGDRRYMAPGSRLFLHHAWAGGEGNSEDFRKFADDLEAVSEQLAAIYAERTGRQIGELRTMMDEETYISAEEALDLGFATDLETELDIAALFTAESTHHHHPTEHPMPTNTQPDLKAYVEEFGEAAGARYVIAGHDLPTARYEHAKAQLSEATAKAEAAEQKLAALALSHKQEIDAKDATIAKLQEQVKALESGTPPAKTGDDSKPDDPGKIDLKAKHAELVATGLSKTQAWAQLAAQHPAEFAVQIRNAK